MGRSSRKQNSPGAAWARKSSEVRMELERPSRREEKREREPGAIHRGGAGARPEHVLAEHPVPAEPAAMEQQAAPVIDAGDQDHGPPSFFGNSTFVLVCLLIVAEMGPKFQRKRKIFLRSEKGGPP